MSAATPIPVRMNAAPSTEAPVTTPVSAAVRFSDFINTATNGMTAPHADGGGGEGRGDEDINEWDDSAARWWWWWWWGREGG